MPTNTYKAIGAVTLAAATSSVTFAVPSGYKDLVLVFDGTLTGGSDILISLNDDTSNTYPNVQMGGNGSTAFSASFTRTGIFLMYGTTDRTNGIAQIFDISATDKHKTGLTRGNRPAGELSAVAGRWPSTSAVTSLSVRVTSNNIASGTTLNLWGIV